MATSPLASLLNSQCTGPPYQGGPDHLGKFKKGHRVGETNRHVCQDQGRVGGTAAEHKVRFGVAMRCVGKSIHPPHPLVSPTTSDAGEGSI